MLDWPRGLNRVSQSDSVARRSATRWVTDSRPRRSKSNRSMDFFVSSVTAPSSWRLSWVRPSISRWSWEISLERSTTAS